MNCSRVAGLLSAYIDGELSPDDMLEVRAHLFNCSSCETEHDTLVKAKGAISGLTRCEPDPELLSFVACRPWEVGHSRHSQEVKPAKTRWVHAAAVILCLAATVGIGYKSAESGESEVAKRSLTESFQAEHARSQQTSPLTGTSFPATPEGSLSRDADSSLAIEYGPSPSDGLVTFVSHTVVE